MARMEEKQDRHFKKRFFVACKNVSHLYIANKLMHSFYYDCASRTQDYAEWQRPALKSCWLAVDVVWKKYIV